MRTSPDAGGLEMCNCTRDALARVIASDFAARRRSDANSPFYFSGARPPEKPPPEVHFFSRQAASQVPSPAALPRMVPFTLSLCLLMVARRFAMPEQTPSEIGLLLVRAKDGSESARGELFEHFCNYLELLARVELGRRLKTKVDPSDVVQESFLEAHRAFSSFRGDTEAEFAAWLRTILGRRVAHLVRRYLHNQGRDVRREQMLDVLLDHSSQAIERGLNSLQSSPSKRASQREQVLLLANALARLPDDYHEVVVLRHFEGLSFAQVAERMERSLDSVQKLWVRALARLRQELE